MRPFAALRRFLRCVAFRIVVRFGFRLDRFFPAGHRLVIWPAHFKFGDQINADFVANSCSVRQPLVQFFARLTRTF